MTDTQSNIAWGAVGSGAAVLIWWALFGSQGARVRRAFKNVHEAAAKGELALAPTAAKAMPLNLAVIGITGDA